MPVARRRDDHRLDPPHVVMLVPGGIEHAGGIGRWAGYMQESWTTQSLEPALEMLDTRATGHAGRAAVVFARALGRLVWLRATNRLGSVHANLSKRGSTARKLIVTAMTTALGVKLVLHLHGSGYDRFYDDLPKFWQRRVAGMFRRADRVVVLGRSWGEWVIGTLGVSPARVEVLHNGVPLPTRPTREAGPCRILLLGRLGPRKGVPELLAALGGADLRARDWTATLAGDGDVERYRREVSLAGLADRVALPGWLDAAAAATLLAQADILVLPSHAENFPMSVIEALAAGVAVVTTPIGATPELLTHERSVLFVPVGDVPALTDALVRLIDDAGLRRRIADAGHAIFVQKLDIAGLARRLAGLHSELVPC